MTAANPTEPATNPVTTVKWFIWSVSSPAADLLFNISNALLMISALAVFLGTIGAVTLSGVREAFANGRLSANERAAAEARQGLAIAQSDIAASQAVAAQAQADAAASNVVAAQANLRTEHLKEQLAWRELTPDKIVKLANIIRGHAFSVRVDNILSDPESLALALQLEGTFRRAGLSIVDGQASMPVKTIPTGIVLAGRTAETALMKAALAEVGLPSTTERHDFPLIVSVGSKPRPTP